MTDALRAMVIDHPVETESFYPRPTAGILHSAAESESLEEAAL
jgi:hypothetical protein